MLDKVRNRAAAVVILLALVVIPAPLLPPNGLTRSVQSVIGVNWKTAYLAAAISLHVALYGSLGVLAAFAVGTGESRLARVLRLVIVPITLVAITLLVRSVRLGHVPVLANAMIPLGACAGGVAMGLLFRQHGLRVAVAMAVILCAALLWICWPGAASDLSRDTEAQLKRLVEKGPTLPSGEERFAAVTRTAFQPLSAGQTGIAAVKQNSVAILALGIALGDERLARQVGLDRNSELVKSAAALRTGTTLRGRSDWVQHYWVSAALVTVGSPFISDASGLMKEQLDALARGSGFSFGDLAADRAGTRFAQAATRSEESALAMQARLQNGYVMDDFFPAKSDLPENLTVEQFRREYGGVGSPRYRQTVSEIESRLDRCKALVATER